MTMTVKVAVLISKICKPCFLTDNGIH